VVDVSVVCAGGGASCASKIAALKREANISLFIGFSLSNLCSPPASKHAIACRRGSLYLILGMALTNSLIY
jgi:hypothetical protein